MPTGDDTTIRFWSNSVDQKYQIIESIIFYLFKYFFEYSQKRFILFPLNSEHWLMWIHDFCLKYFSTVFFICHSYTCLQATANSEDENWAKNFKSSIVIIKIGYKWRRKIQNDRKETNYDRYNANIAVVSIVQSLGHLRLVQTA